MVLSDRVRRWSSAVLVFGALLTLVLLLFSAQSWALEKQTGPARQVRIELFGKVLNSHGSGVGDAQIQVSLDGTPLKVSGLTGHGEARDFLTTESDGSYQAPFWVQAGQVTDESKLEITAYKSSFSKSSYKINGYKLTKEGSNFIGLADIQIERTTGPAFWIAAIVFILAYILISFELLHRTMAAMLGASIMLVISYTFGTLNPEYRILSY